VRRLSLYAEHCLENGHVALRQSLHVNSFVLLQQFFLRVLNGFHFGQKILVLFVEFIPVEFGVCGEVFLRDEVEVSDVDDVRCSAGDYLVGFDGHLSQQEK
jgi:hypothetical protein